MSEELTGWPAQVAQRYRALGIWSGQTLSEALAQSVVDHEAKVAVVDGERRLAYGQLWQRSEQLASGFAELGVHEQPPAGPLSRQEIDDIVERAIAEELARLSAPASKSA